MPAAIIHWLNNPDDYTKGVDLFEQYGDNTTLLKVLRRRESDFNRETLVNALKSIQDAEKSQKQQVLKNESIAVTQPIASTESIHPSFKDRFPANAPTWLQDMITEQVDLYARAKAIHGRLMAISKRPLRKALAAELIDIRERVDIIWQFRDYFQLTGKKLGEEIMESPVELTKRRVLVVNYIIKHKNGNQVKHEKYKTELLEIDRKLKILNAK